MHPFSIRITFRGLANNWLSMHILFTSVRLGLGVRISQDCGSHKLLPGVLISIVIIYNMSRKTVHIVSFNHYYSGLTIRFTLVYEGLGVYVRVGLTSFALNLCLSYNEKYCFSAGYRRPVPQHVGGQQASGGALSWASDH